MADKVSFLDDLRSQYEAARGAVQGHSAAEGFQALDARLRKAFRWLEKAIAYLDGIAPRLDHRFDLGHGVAFDRPRFQHGFVGQHTRRIVGYPVLDQINVTYEVVAAKPLALEVAGSDSPLVEAALEQAAVRYSARRVEGEDGTLRRCAFSIPGAIPASISFVADYQTGVVDVALVNVDRFDRVTLAFDSHAIEEPMLEALVRFILGQDAAFLRLAPLAGIHGVAPPVR